MYMWQSFNIHEIERKFGTNIEVGLTKEEALKRKEKYGENKLQEQKKESLLIRFLKQFNDFMIIILIIAAIVSAGVSYMEGQNDYIDSIIIIAIVVLNAIMGVAQETKAEKSIEALKSMSSPISKVRRGGRTIEVQSSEIVPGDIVLLDAGNFVPADCRLIKSSNLKIEESSLTGETVPVDKNADVLLREDVAIGDTVNMAFANTIVVNGHAEGIVTETGMSTKVGKIANMIITNEAPETPIQKKLGEVGKTLGMACLAICAIIFVIGVLKKIPAVQMFMTSVGLAVAAIPEGLPAIVTIMLSIGVTRMARKNSIIRKLPAVETLGSSSVICSDKTGTLTQNKMQVKSVVDINGKSMKQQQDIILELGTMCTDVEGEVGEATELAIVNAAKMEGKFKERLYQKFARIADIPFDSTRKMMTTIHKVEDKGELEPIFERGEDRFLAITKGAPDVLLKKCTKYYFNGKIYDLESKEVKQIEKQNNIMADNALRVIAVAYSLMPRLPTNIEEKSIEQNLIFVRTNRND